MDEELSGIIVQMGRVGRWMAQRGWAEANAGNISERIPAADCQNEPSLNRDSDWTPLECAFPHLSGEYFLITRAGAFLRHIELYPARTLGLIELDADGRRYRTIWGFEGNGRPTSEILSHLEVHSARKRSSAGRERVFLHCHTPNLIALSYILPPDTAPLTCLLWQMHIECILACPDGVEFIPWKLSGSRDLATATAQALAKRRAALWQFHGVSVAADNLDNAFGLVEILEKAAGTYLTVRSAGGFKQRLTLEQITALARSYHLEPDPEILKACKRETRYLG